MIDIETKRFKIYNSASTNKNFSQTQKTFISALEVKLNSDKELEGIYFFLEKALDNIKKLSERLEKLNAEEGSLNDKAKVLRDIKNYIYSYNNVLTQLRENDLDEMKEADDRYKEKIRAIIKDIRDLNDNLKIDYKRSAIPLFTEFIRPFLGNKEIVVPFGKDKGKVIKIEDLIRESERDISFMELWVDSMAESTDFMHKLFDSAVKKAKHTARLRTLDKMAEIQKLGIELEQAGVKGFEWMFEKDVEGNLTGNYVVKYDWPRYSADKQEMLKRLAMRYGENPTGDAKIACDAEKKAWYDAHLQDDPNNKGARIPIDDYLSDDYKEITGAKKVFYDKFLEIKKELDDLLPPHYTKLTNAIKIRKDLVERVKSSDGVKSGAQQVWEAIKDNFMVRGDDIDYADRATVKDFEGNEVQNLTVYYTKLRKGESANDISTDAVSTLIAYAAMAYDFNEMNKIIHALEVGRDVMRGNDMLPGRQIGTGQNEKLSALGRTITSKLFKTGNESNFMKRLNEYFSMQVYGRYIKDEGTFGNTGVSRAKTADAVTGMTALNSLAFNVLSGVSNVATGTVMMNIEAAAEEFFTRSDLLKADATYAKMIVPFLGQVGSRIKDNKLYLFGMLFDVMQEYEANIKDMNFDRKTWYSRMFSHDTFYIMNNSGEHWMQHRTALALAMQFKLKDKNNVEHTLWDSLEPQYLDPNDHSKGARLVVKEGYTKLDGTAYTEDDIIEFTRKSAAINQRMHGIYNKLDKNVIQNVALGRAAFEFRKWIVPSLNKRYRTLTYSFDLNTWEEGYYRTTGRFMWQLMKDARHLQFHMLTNFRNLDDIEKKNIKRAICEVGHFLLLLALFGLLEWPDDKKEHYMLNMLEYQLNRLYTEVGALVPTPLAVKEIWRILKSPAASVKTLEEITDLIGLLYPYNYEMFGGEDALIKSGRFKGESKATRLIWNSPLIPMNRTLYRSAHPEELIPFFYQ